MTFQFLEGGEPAFLCTPPLDLFEIDSASLLPTDERRLIKIGSGVPMDVTCQTILHTIGWREQPKSPTLNLDFIRHYWKFFTDLHRTSGKLKEKMRAQRMLEISGLARHEADFLQSIRKLTPIKIVGHQIKIT